MMKIWKKMLGSREAGMILILGVLVLVIVLSGERPRKAFFSPINQQNLTRQIAMLTTFSLGEVVVIIAGGIDLSVSSLIALVGVLEAIFLERLGVGLVSAIFLGLIIATIIGTLQGILIGRLALPPFIVTLGGMCIMRGLALLLTDAVPIAIVNVGYEFIGNGKVGPIPVPVIICLGMFIVITFVVHYTIYGRHIFAIGGNERVAKIAGINVPRIKILAYILSALCAGVAGIVFSAYDRQGNPSSGVGYELNAIASAVIGGASLMGGEGSTFGTLIGAAILCVILNGLNLVVKRNASLWEGIIVGTVVLVAVAVNTLRVRKSRSRE